MITDIDMWKSDDVGWVVMVTSEPTLRIWLEAEGTEALKSMFVEALS